MRKTVTIAVMVMVMAMALPVSGGSTPSASPAALFLARKAPVKLRGAAFRPRESVRVLLVADKATWTRTIRASATGAFLVTFVGVRLDPCEIEARASGSRGSRVSLKLPERMCLIGLASPTP